MGKLKAEDFTMPFDSTRPEIIAFKYTGAIKNVGEMMFNATLMHPEEYQKKWIKNYPKLEMLRTESDIEKRFYLSSFYTGPEFLKFMRDTLPPLSIAEIQHDYSRIRSRCSPYHCSTTNIEVMARNLALNDLACSKIYIYDEAFSDDSKLYLSDLFKGCEHKVVLITKSFEQLMEEKPEITMVFNDSSDEVMSYLQKEDDYSKKFEGKTFMISAHPNIIKVDDNNAPFKWHEYLSSSPQRFNCLVHYWQMKYINL